MEAKITITTYICGLLGVEPEMIPSVKQELLKLQNPNLFREFCRNNFNNSELSYKNGFQKFLILLNMHLAEEVRNLDTKSLASELAQRTIDYFCRLYSLTSAGEVDYFSEGVTNAIMHYFTIDELNLLARIGDRKFLAKYAYHARAELQLKIFNLYNQEIMQKFLITKQNQIS